MKTLLIAGALAAGLAFPLASQAEVDVFGVRVPVERNEVSDSLKGGYVAKDLGDTFTVQTLSESSRPSNAESDNRNNYYVFGVRVDNGRAI